jgi:eukaryotic-like serine/threonine-protein kinase
MLPQIPTTRIPATDLRQICAELERCLNAGQASSAEAVLAEHPDLSGDVDAALELIYTEFVTRELLGQRPTPDRYYATFPQWRDELEQLFQIHDTVGANLPAGSSRTSLLDADRISRLDRPTLLDGQEIASAVLRRIANYEVLCEIGRGGMGVVYKARQIGLKRLVALKMILAGMDAGPHERARFHAEAEVAARLHHPNIVQIHEVGEHEGRPFLCLEFVDGVTLEKLLTGIPLPPMDVARLIETLARAMHYAHQQGVVHRDLKPANVLLQITDSKLGIESTEKAALPDLQFAIAKITDFGLARRLPDGDTGAVARTGPTRTGAIVGTPAYMAPEQAAGDGRAIGPAADVHALGAILYELLTGRPPYKGITVLETLEQVRGQDPLPASRLAPALPRDLETICLKCLEKEPARRYVSAAALADELGRFQRGEPILARPTPAWEKAWKWACRRPAVAALLVSLVALTIVALSSVTILWRQTVAALVAVRKERDDKEAELASKLIALAERDWLANDLEAARRHLDECPATHRGPEWQRLHRLCHACLFVLPGEGSIRAVAWDKQGRSVAVGRHAEAIQIWDALTGREGFSVTGSRSGVGELAVNPDGHLIALSSVQLVQITAGVPRSAELKIWDLEARQELSSFVADVQTRHTALSRTGQHLFFGNKVRNLATGKESNSIPGIVNYLESVSLDQTGRLLAIANFRGLRVWDIANAAAVGPEFAHRYITKLIFDPDANRLAVVFRDPKNTKGYVDICDIRSGKVLVELREHAGAIHGADFSPDGRHLATCSADKTVKVWDAGTGKELLTLRGHTAPVLALAFSPDGTRLASGGTEGNVHIWDVRLGNERTE